MWSLLIWLSFDFTTLIQGRVNNLHNFNTWSYRGNTHPNNTHNNAENVSNVSFNSYQFVGGRLGFYFLICSASYWVLVPWDSASASSSWISSAVSCLALGITTNVVVQVLHGCAYLVFSGMAELHVDLVCVNVSRCLFFGCSFLLILSRCPFQLYGCLPFRLPLLGGQNIGVVWTIVELGG